MRILLVNPTYRASFWTLAGAAPVTRAPGFMPPLALATLAALTPPDVDVEIVDESVQALDLDADCDVGDCAPSLLVTGSVPSDPNCINLPVEAGSSGQINYPCEGGMVTATLDAVSFSGTVSSNGQVALFGSEQVIGPDNCLWQLDHSITGSLPSGTVQYFYEETLLTMPQGNCWFPCTETGTVDIDWEG